MRLIYFVACCLVGWAVVLAIATALNEGGDAGYILAGVACLLGLRFWWVQRDYDPAGD